MAASLGWIFFFLPEKIFQDDAAGLLPVSLWLRTTAVSSRARVCTETLIFKQGDVGWSLDCVVVVFFPLAPVAVKPHASSDNVVVRLAECFFIVFFKKKNFYWSYGLAVQMTCTVSAHRERKKTGLCVGLRPDSICQTHAKQLHKIWGFCVWAADGLRKKLG